MSEEISVRLRKISKYASSRSAGNRWPPNIEAEVRALRELGVSVTQMSLETGITPAMLYKWLSPRRLNQGKARSLDGPIESDIKVIEVQPRPFAFQLRWHHLEVRFH